MAKNIMTSGIEMSDVIKSTGFPVPEDMEGKTFAEVVEGGGSGDITVEALSATENKVYTAPEGKAYSPVTVNVPTVTVEALSVTENGTHTAPEGKAYSPVTVNVPSENKLYCFVADSTYYVYVAGNPCTQGTGTYTYTMYTSGSVASKLNVYKNKTMTRVSDTEMTLNAFGEGDMTFVRDATGDIG